MRDIRRDLAERINVLKEQLSAANTEFERQINKVKQEHDSKLRHLKADLNAVNTLLEAEQRRFGNSPSVPQPQEAPPRPEQPDQAQSPPRLLDILILKLSDDGPASSDDLRHWAVRKGYLDDSDPAGSALHRALTETAKAGLIRQLPDGRFAAASITDLIRLRSAV
jgi:hypothetical protein